MSQVPGSPRPSRAAPCRSLGARTTTAVLTLGMLGVSLAPAASGTTDADAPATSVTVQVAEGTQDAVRAQLEGIGITPTEEFTEAIDGFAIEATPAEVAAVEALPEVAAVRPDTVFSATDTRMPGSWGTDRLDQATLPLDWSFSYPPTAGAGVRVYVLDTGVDGAHPAFTGRVEAGYSVFGGQGNQDCNGHGTHVAGVVATEIALRAGVVPVQVLDCNGDGDTTTVLGGVEWVLQNHVPGTPAVVNVSLGGRADPFVDQAVERLRAAGLFVAVAAGNDSVDACGASPARTPGAYTVGATTRTDRRAAFSNWGPCLDLYAPGEQINSMLPQMRSGVMSGTSQAAPHVTGAAALYLGENPGATADQIEAALDAAATPSVVVDAGPGSTTSLLSTRALVPPRAGDPLPPTRLRVTSVARTSATVAWDPPAAGPAPTDYRVWVSNLGEGRRLVDDGVSTTPSAVLTGLRSREVYQVTVETVSGSLVSWASTYVNVQTLGNQAPTGNYESLSASGTTVSLKGWALDPDAVGAIDVHLYVDGAWGGLLRTTGVRPDVAAAFPGTGDQHGFSHAFTAAPGPHEVCVFAIDTESAEGKRLGCRTVTVANRLPVGNFESVGAAGSAVTVKGWTLDPDAAAPVNVHLYVDGAWGGSVVTDVARPDVAAAYPGAGPRQGFTRTLTARPGSHQVCAYAIDNQANANTALGCRTVVVPANRAPLTNFESLTASGSTVTLTGWALDPDTAGAIDVHVYVDGGWFTALRTTGVRADVARVYPGTGDQHGFTKAFTAAPGTHQVCTYAIDTAGGPSTAAGCRTITVR